MFLFFFVFFSAEASFAGDFPVPPPYSVATSLPTYDEAEKAKAAAMAASAVEVIPRVSGREITAAGSFSSLFFFPSPGLMLQFIVRGFTVWRVEMVLKSCGLVPNDPAVLATYVTLTLSDRFLCVSSIGPPGRRLPTQGRLQRRRPAPGRE